MRDGCRDRSVEAWGVSTWVLEGKYFTRGDEDYWEGIVVTCPWNRIDVRNF